MESPRKTISTIFIVPTLKIPRETLKENGFINAYEHDEGQDVPYPNSVYLLFKPTNMHTFRAFLDSEYERTTNIIDDYDYGRGFVVVVYKLDSRYLNDFKLVRQGRYSKTSKKFQSEFSKTTKLLKGGLIMNETSLQYRIFNKTQDLKDYWEEKLGVKFSEEQEVWETYDNGKEVLTSAKLEEYA